MLEKLLDFYPRKPPKRILDATVNKGRFWVGSSRPVTGMDVDLRHKPDVVGDCTAMPFKDGSFNVVVYDPPHVPNQGKDKIKDFTTRFGLGEKSSAANGYNFSHLYPPFMAEAYRVLRAEGILLCKITDYIHNHRYQWAHLEVIKAATAVGFLACDCIVKVRKGPIIDPKWKEAHHARRHHCYWLVFRKKHFSPCPRGGADGENRKRKYTLSSLDHSIDLPRVWRTIALPVRRRHGGGADRASPAEEPSRCTIPLSVVC